MFYQISKENILRKNFRKIKIVAQDGFISIDEDGNRYNNSGNCSNKGRNWNLYERISK